MENKEVKIESSMEERFDGLPVSFCCNGNYCEVDCDDHTRKIVKSFIQQEIDLAVAKREKEIVESIREYAEPYEGSKWLNEVNAQKIINLITNK